MKHQHTLTRGPRYAGKGDHEFYANADNGPRISTYFLSDEDWQAMGCPDEVVLTVAPHDHRGDELMCNHANREAAMTVLGPKICCDPCLTPLIKALNDGGIRTTSSCCGHHHRPGSISLADGRWLMIAPDDEWMNWLSSRIYERVGDMPGHEPIYVPGDATEAREALTRLARVEALAERAARKGYDLDPDEVLEVLAPTTTDEPS